MIYIGIDPGKKGGVAYLCEQKYETYPKSKPGSQYQAHTSTAAFS